MNEETKRLAKKAYYLIAEKTNKEKYGDQVCQMNLRVLLRALGDPESFVLTKKDILPEKVRTGYEVLASSYGFNYAMLKESRKHPFVTIRMAYFIYILHTTGFASSYICQCFDIDHTTGINIRKRYEDEQFHLDNGRHDLAIIHSRVTEVEQLLKEYF